MPVDACRNLSVSSVPDLDSLPAPRLAPLLAPLQTPPADARSDYRATVGVQAYVLIQTEVGKAASVAAAIRSIDGVTLADDVTGPYDVIVRAAAPSIDELGALVVARIQAVPGITRTLTCPVVHL